MHGSIRSLIDAEALSRRIDELADQINTDYAGKELVLIGVLNGSFVFLSDLVRRLRVPCSVDFLRAASYGSATISTGVVEIRKDIEISVTGRHALLVEDIVDTGLTLDFLVNHLGARQPASLKTCTLLDKPSRRLVSRQPDYVGFVIEDVFVVGFGLDYNERYREIPAICVLECATHDR